MPLWIGSDQVLELAGLRDAIAGTFINDAAVTAVVKDESETEVAGQAWPATLDYVAASDGVYRGNLENGLALTKNAHYWIEVTADLGGDAIHFWRWVETARYRRPGD